MRVSANEIVNKGDTMQKFFTSFLFAMAIYLIFPDQAEAQLAIESKRIDKIVPSIDGDLSDWTGFKNQADRVPFTLLGGPEIVDGKNAWEHRGDYSANVAFAHNSHALYFAATVQDDTVVRTEDALTTEDHIELLFAVLKGKNGDLRPFGLGIFADPMSGKIEVRMLGNKKGSTNKILSNIDAAISGIPSLYSYEVRIPWSVLPLDKAKWAGMRAAVFAVDCDSPEGKTADTIIGTAPISARSDHTQLPLLGLSDVMRPLNAFLKRMKLSPREPSRYFAALDLASGSEIEQAIVAGKYLMAFGPEINNTDNYSFIELPVESADDVVGCEYLDVTGDSKKDIVLEFEVDKGTEVRRWISIYQLDESHNFQKIFSAATLLYSLKTRVENDLRFVKGPNRSLAVRLKAKKIKEQGEAQGDSVPEVDGTPMVVPWEKPSQVTYTFLNGQYVKK